MTTVLTRYHHLRRDQDGQAIILGCVMVLILALAVLGTVNLSKTTHERIRLQNAADNAAYSLATHEARAFNFYAFSNRTQISQYVTVMQLVSMNSTMLFFYGFLGFVKGFADTLASLCDGVCGKVICALPIVGEIVQAIALVGQIIDQIIVAVRTFVDLADRLIGRVIVPLIAGANQAMFALDKAYKLATLGLVSAPEALRIARLTHPEAEGAGAVSDVTLSVINAQRFNQAHSSDAEALPGSPENGATTSDKNFARRGLGELVHATRYDFWVYDRTFPDRLGGFIRNTGPLQPVLDFVGLISGFLPIKFPGHTRLLSAQSIRPKDCKPYKDAEGTGYAWGTYPSGNQLMANHYFYLGAPSAAARRSVCTPDLPWWLEPMEFFNNKVMASVMSVDAAASSRGSGWHCGWTGQMHHQDIPPWVTCLTVYWPKFDCTDFGGHPWDGLTPYMAYQIGDEPLARGKFADEHNQPDAWVALHLPIEKTNLTASTPGHGTSAIDVQVATPSGPERAMNVNTVAAAPRLGPLPVGMNVISRATAYYHRPGNWQEHPNLFNPFWRAKLAPIKPGLDRIPALGELTRAIPPALSDMALTH